MIAVSKSSAAALNRDRISNRLTGEIAQRDKDIRELNERLFPTNRDKQQFFRILDELPLEKGPLWWLNNSFNSKIWTDTEIKPFHEFRHEWEYKGFDDPQVQARGMRIEMPHASAGKVPLIRGPMRFSETPVEHKIGPPLLGQHTDEVLSKALGKSAAEIAKLKADGIV